MPFSSGTYTVAVDFGTEAASPPIEIALLDQQMADLATALSNCILRDGTGVPTAAIPFGSQDVTGMNTLTIANALADTNTLILTKGGSKIAIARSSDDALSFIIGSAAPGSSVMSIKNSSGSASELQLDAAEIRWYTNSVQRLQLTSAGVWKLPLATAGSTLIIASGTAIPAGGQAGMGVVFSTTANFGLFVGSGAPSISAAKGSLYLRSDGSSSSTRVYVASDGAGTWVAVTTAS